MTPSKIIRVVPAAKRAARKFRIDVSKVVGSGRGGIILKEDVDRYIAAEKMSTYEKGTPTKSDENPADRDGASLADFSELQTRAEAVSKTVMRTTEQKRVTIFGQTIRMTQLRKIIAKRMAGSAFTAPHIYFFTDVEMDKLLQLRKELLTHFETTFRVRLSVNDFILKAVGLTIREYPLLNACIDGENIRINPEINVGLAVALKEGLIVPAIANTDCLGLGDIAIKRVDLVERARKGKLCVDEIEIGTFTVSSLAQSDINFFTAILNPPQCGILSVGKLNDKMTLINEEITFKKVTCFGLSVDHRIIDGTVAAQFLQSLKKRLENPSFAFLQL